MPLYHCSLGFPESVDKPYGRLLLKYTRHAMKAAKNDRYGDMRYALPGHVNAYTAQLVEVETDEEGKQTKVVYRVSVTRNLDLCLAMSRRWDRWVVRTCWANRRDDKHATLNIKKYTPVAA